MGLPLPDDLEQLIGKTVKLGDSEYDVVSFRGSGKRGYVFRAKRKEGGNRAIKFVPMRKFSRGSEQEALKAHKLEDQPNTVRFHHLAYYGEGKYAVMVFDFVDGRGLDKIIRSGKLRVGDIQRVLQELLFFRRDCLRIGLQHGDLHPGNIILRERAMGSRRAYEVNITDFGIGYTGAVLKPKDDLQQIGAILTRMLQSVTRERLDHKDRVVYDELCHGAGIKRLREFSPLERGKEEGAIGDVLEELETVQRRVQVPESATVHARFGDYLVGEQLGSRWKEWKELFVSTFPGYEDIVSQNTSVLTGTRGCGKTMVFRRLSALLALEVGPVDTGAAGSLVGIYLNMNDLADAFLFQRRKSLSESFAKRVIQFFHLCLLAEIVRVAGVARDKADDAERDVHDAANRWLFESVLKDIDPNTLYPGAGLELRVLGSVIEQTKDEIRRSKGVHKRAEFLAENDWLKRFVPNLRKRMPWIGGRPIYFFLDDYSLPRVNKSLQKVLNSVIFQRSECFFFKISTESPSTLYREDYSDKILGDPHDFELTDLGSVTIDLRDEDRETFLDEVFRRRFSRDDRFRNASLGEVLGEFKTSWVELARRIRKEFSGKGENGEVSKVGDASVKYYGREVFLNMWSGDTRSMVKIAQNLLEQLPGNETPKLPIESKLQNKVFRNTGGEFLHLLKACTRTGRGRDAEASPRISSWGEHLVKVAEAFKEVALHELRTRQGGRKGREDEPKQAFRIEIIDEFSLSGIEREIYEDLIRYGVFLRDDRGKSIRGAIIPRLYLRRLLIPYCTLTFSKIDHVHMYSSGFKRLLLYPNEFAKSWKKDRGQFGMEQGEFDFE